MKTTLALAVVLAAIAVVCDSSVIQASSRADLIVGTVVNGDRLLFRLFTQRNASPNPAQPQDITWRGNATDSITAIRATELEGSQYASASILAGGLGRNTVTMRFQSFIGYGFNYQLDVWGR